MLTDFYSHSMHEVLKKTNEVIHRGVQNCLRSQDTDQQSAAISVNRHFGQYFEVVVNGVIAAHVTYPAFTEGRFHFKHFFFTGEQQPWLSKIFTAS